LDLHRAILLTKLIQIFGKMIQPMKIKCI